MKKIGYSSEISKIEQGIRIFKLRENYISPHLDAITWFLLKLQESEIIFYIKVLLYRNYILTLSLISWGGEGAGANGQKWKQEPPPSPLGSSPQMDPAIQILGDTSQNQALQGSYEYFFF